ncbi:beta-galactosidase [Enterocloster clostridioformis]|uniref:glycoside hydrolase family 2 TIM barrel-domain containing protein n=1 Tax=Enterocloster clostridioformis TaxID=1531 RepID=UPI00080C39D0|nr:glycoside hydrolase family 2 TIM barrel-domain containing protein [Enterocloster clostridioformis]ANU49268.1 beta-galactosidase [Lachnoclostridium sp. YL32]NDO31898.1 beta-galactosidase [Enterocloster clostridioformis]OXE64393.1 beta-galactosidase [Enterocloster clostridioformis]QQR01804.1 beta-galactosidase [Enterocloster clostridioformis]
MKAELKWLEDPRIFRINRLDAHSDHMYYGSEAEMEAGESGFLQSLNGAWRFAWSRCPGDRPADFFKEGYDTGKWDLIQVPGHMEMQGYDKIHYINTMYPWEGHVQLRPPHIDWEYNPVGSYVTEFDLADGLKEKRVCISFQGVEEAFYVWLNGQFVGYAEDTFTPSDFDLTPYIREKGNRLCVEVYKRSSAAWLEDQDFFRFSGIFRDVFLYAKPRIHVEDVWARAGLKEDYSTGVFSLDMKISHEETGENGFQLEWVLYDRDGKRAAGGSVEEDASRGHAYAEIPGVRPWSSRDPYMYRLFLTLRDSGGNVVEMIPMDIGFRRFEIKDKIMLLNGERIIVNGVNRHEWNPRTGRSITEEDMRKDIEILKRSHINAVRTSHYPNQSLWYRLCDENGIYVMDETNLESHGSWQKMGQCEPSWNVPGSLPEWEDCVVDRAVSMLERDKNHPCILWWSCGNESYAGTCNLAMSRYFHEKDPSRLVHYEGVYWNREFNEISDVESRMYAPLREVRDYLEHDPQKPYLLCEYMHDMGNSIGGMESYISLLDEFPMYQGGFIWDYIDQAIYRRDVDGREVLGYGGDFGDRPTDYAFSGNGIVFADRTEKPAMQEVRYWYSTKEEREAFDRKNREAEALALEQTGIRDAGQTETTAQDFAAEQDFTVIHGDVTLGVKGAGFHVIFSYSEHGMVSLVYDGLEWIYRPGMPAFWRASTENDKGNGFPVKSAVWCGADQFIRCTGWHTEGSRCQVRITYDYAACTVPETQVSVSYTVDAAGTVQVRCHYRGQKGLPQLPLFGLRFTVPFVADNVRWQGRSGETYPDRKKGGAFGIWESPIEKPDYLVPQEYGCHMDTHWVKLYGPADAATAFAGESGMDGGRRRCLEIAMEERPFHFSAIPYTPQELESALHREELPAPRRTVVSVLGAMRGVGGIDSWGSDVEPAYRVPADEDIEYGFVIRRG